MFLLLASRFIPRRMSHYVIRVCIGRLILWLESKGLREKIVNGINDCVDIPMIDEKTEQIVFDALYLILRNAVIDTGSDSPKLLEA